MHLLVKWETQWKLRPPLRHDLTWTFFSLRQTKIDACSQVRDFLDASWHGFWLMNMRTHAPCSSRHKNYVEMLVSRQCCASLSVYKTINSHVTIHMCTKQVLTMFIYIYIYIWGQILYFINHRLLFHDNKVFFFFYFLSLILKINEYLLKNIIFSINKEIFL
jgi:hypothetical protein